jgi:exoribonuclease II
MTQTKMHDLKAKNFIDNVISKSKLPYDELMQHLENKLEDWRSQYNGINHINIFDLEDGEYDRKNYLDSLMRYADKLILNYKLKYGKFSS